MQIVENYTCLSQLSEQIKKFENDEVANTICCGL